MKKIFLVLTLLVSGFAATDGYFILGPGSYKCAKFLSDIDVDKNNRNFTKSMYQMWSTGYVSGLNENGGGKSWDTSNEEIYYSWKRACEDNPTHYSYRVVSRLWGKFATKN
tara:strand:+ start:380 stop:712 length:333 start_codon:yes stop_codon:yes gene_type:complete